MFALLLLLALEFLGVALELDGTDWLAIEVCCLVEISKIEK